MEKKYNEWLLLHNFRYPEEKPKSWINETNFINNFKNDWNELMEVIDKIESLDFIFQIYHNVVNIFNGETKENGIYNETFQGKTKIKTVYDACVEFIKWHNEQD